MILAPFSLLALIFIPVTYFWYWKSSQKTQEFLLILGSLFFLAYFHWSLPFLLLILIGINYGLQKNRFFKFGIAFNLLLIGLIKTPYLNQSKAFHLFLPISLSYFLIQIVAHFLDQKRNLTSETLGFKKYSLFHLFFPQVLIGPIERYDGLLAQLSNKREFKYKEFKSGIFLILFGLFKKFVISDGLAPVMGNFPHEFPQLEGINVILFCYLAFFSLYTDFSGYMDIAKGVGRLFDLNITPNFNRPYLSQNPSDYWSRWHISLIRFIREGLYLPVLLKTKNIPIAIIVSYGIIALWHDFALPSLYWAAYWIILHLTYHHFIPRAKGLGIRTTGHRSYFKIFTMFNFACLSTLFLTSSPIRLISKIFFFPSLGLNAQNFLNLNWNILEATTVLGSIILVLFIENLIYAKNLLEKQTLIFKIMAFILIFLLISLASPRSLFFYYMSF